MNKLPKPTHLPYRLQTLHGSLSGFYDTLEEAEVAARELAKKLGEGIRIINPRGHEATWVPAPAQEGARVEEDHLLIKFPAGPFTVRDSNGIICVRDSWELQEALRIAQANAIPERPIEVTDFRNEVIARFPSPAQEEATVEVRQYPCLGELMVGYHWYPCEVLASVEELGKLGYRVRRSEGFPEFLVRAYRIRFPAPAPAPAPLAAGNAAKSAASAAETGPAPAELAAGPGELRKERDEFKTLLAREQDESARLRAGIRELIARHDISLGCQHELRQLLEPKRRG